MFCQKVYTISFPLVRTFHSLSTFEWLDRDFGLVLLAIQCPRSRLCESCQIQATKLRSAFFPFGSGRLRFIFRNSCCCRCQIKSIFEQQLAVYHHKTLQLLKAPLAFFFAEANGETIKTKKESKGSI